MHLAYIRIVSHLSAKNYQNWCKFDEVLTKTNLLSFFGTRCRSQTQHQRSLGHVARKDSSIYIRYAVPFYSTSFHWHRNHARCIKATALFFVISHSFVYMRKVTNKQFITSTIFLIALLHGSHSIYRGSRTQE